MNKNAHDFKSERDAIREKISLYVHGKRHAHTLSVERECAALADIFSLDELEKEQLCIAALLHDITKERSAEEQFELMRKLSLPFTDYDRHYVKLFHAKTAAYLIPHDFPSADTELIRSAVLYHTSGRENMTLTEKLLYLADYIEAERTFEDCVVLRKYFYDGINSGHDILTHLDNTLLLSFDMTIRILLEDGKPVHPDTVKSRNYLVTHQLSETA